MRSFSELKRENSCLFPFSENPSATRNLCAASAFLTSTATSLARMQRSKQKCCAPLRAKTRHASTKLRISTSAHSLVSFILETRTACCSNPICFASTSTMWLTFLRCMKNCSMTLALRPNYSFVHLRARAKMDYSGIPQRMGAKPFLQCSAQLSRSQMLS